MDDGEGFILKDVGVEGAHINIFHISFLAV
jgi:hypothetical protein